MFQICEHFTRIFTLLILPLAWLLKLTKFQFFFKAHLNFYHFSFWVSKFRLLLVNFLLFIESVSFVLRFYCICEKPPYLFKILWFAAKMFRLTTRLSHFGRVSRVRSSQIATASTSAETPAEMKTKSTETDEKPWENPWKHALPEKSWHFSCFESCVLS